MGVMNLNVEPEFPQSITFSGVLGLGKPQTFSVSFGKLVISAPSMRHALIVARVSSQINGLRISDIPSERADAIMARCV